MITFLVVGRNDGFGLNLSKRTAISLNFFASLCEDDDDEIVYVDCNTPEGEITLTESVFDTLTAEARRRIKTFRISGELMYGAIGNTPMPFSDELSRNVGIRRSNPSNSWILSTNCDLVIQPISGSLHEVIKNLSPQLYHCPRHSIAYEQWRNFNRMNVESVADFCSGLAQRGLRFPPEVDHPWQRFQSVGDFQLAPRSQWIDIGGCEEGMSLWGHSDANNAKRFSLLNKCPKTPDLGNKIHLFHLDHNLKKAVSANADIVPPNDTKRWIADVFQYKSHNPPNWGLQGVDLPSPSLSELGNIMDDSHTILKLHRRPRRSLSVLRIKFSSILSRLASRIMDRLKL